MATTTIRVSRDTRDHLAQLAEEQGLSLGQCVQQLAKKRLTATQRAERLAADRKALRALTGCDISDDEFDQAPDVMGNICRIAAERVRAARGDAG
ncbi:hypothetical protein ACWY4P_23265 [Streptomyces sp. LZ34]